MSIIIGIVVVGISLIFAFQNTDFVAVKFLSFDFEGSLALVILSSLLIGFIIAILLLTPSIFRTNSSLRKLKKENINLKEKNNDIGIVYESEGLGEVGEYKGGKNQ
ncbi:LapA family protein [Candidatus Nomurabacteria bacterium]|nr:LapA family protein [Candidatus Nomurabacteria bacterium]